MKLLIIEACTIAGEEFSSHAEVGATPDVPKDEAGTLTRMGRALYLNKDDDPTKGQLTASSDDRDMVKRRVTAIKQDLADRAAVAEAQSPVGMAQIIASAVATAVQSAMAANASASKPPVA